MYKVLRTASLFRYYQLGIGRLW